MYRQLEERLGKIYRRYKHPDGGKGKKGGTASGALLEPIYEEIPEQRSITTLPSSAIESNRSSELGMEYDDVETILLGKLSARDLAGVVDIEPEGEEEFTPLQFETEADTEPVKEQPLYVNIQADIEPVKEQPLYVNIQTEEQPLYVNIQADKKSSLSSKVKKRRHKHHSKPESTHHHHSHHHSHHSRHKKHGSTEDGGPHSRLTHQMGVASPDRPLPPPPSFPPPPPPPYASPQRAPPNAPSLIDFDTPPQD
jgi:hypothetical protein